MGGWNVAEPFVSFDEVKSQVSIVDVLRKYGYLDALQQKGNQLIGLCPFHKEGKERSPSFKVTPARNIWHCFSGACPTGKGGDVIDLVCAAERIPMAHRNSARRRAALLLQQWFGIATSSPPQAKETATSKSRHCKAMGGEEASDPAADQAPEGEAATPETAAAEQQRAPEADEPPSNPPLTFTFKYLDPTHPYLLEQGLTDETVATFGLGYHAGRGIMHGRIVIPIHNEAGELIAYAGRWPGDDPPDGEPKYKFPPKFHKSLVLFNLHRARAHAAEGLIVVEGFFSGVLTLWQQGRRNVVAIMGSSLSDAQERLIVQTISGRGRVLLAFDNDEAGKKGMAEAAARLTPQVFVRTLALA